MIKKLFFVSLLSVMTCRLEAVIAIGTDPNAATTFPFSIGSAIYNSATESTWAATDQDLSASDANVQKYGISFTPFIPVDNSTSNLKLIAFPNITLSATTSQFITDLTVLTGQTNPLLGKAYSGLTLIGSNVTVVLTTEPNSIYYMQSVAFNDNAQGLVSAAGTSIINKLEYGAGEQVHLIAGIGSSNLLSAYAPGAFGSAGSTLSFVQLMPKVLSTGSDTSTYSCLVEQANAPITIATPVLTANGADLLNIGTSVAMYPSGASMYVGVDVASAIIGSAVGLFTAAGVNSQGVDPGSLTFSSVISDAVANNGLNISTPISVSTSLLTSYRVAVRNISTTSTSTGLGYLFVASDDGVDAQSIYAMPMVTMPVNNPDLGQVAAFNSVETVFKIVATEYRSQGFSQPITDAAEIDINTIDPVVKKRLLVGGGVVPVVSGQYINQLVVQGDAVYITIDEQFATGTTPGMFKSQALFDATGRIMSWTSWQRVGGTDDQMLFSIKNRVSDATMFMSPSIPGGIFNNIEQTTWNSSGIFQAFEARIRSVLPKNNGGVQAVIPFSSTTPGFTLLPTSQVSLVAATGNGNVVIAQTGQLDIPTQTFQILPQTDMTSTVINSSLGLTIGSVVAADFGDDGAGGNWLFMAGDGGLSVLSHVDGSGFTALPNDGAASSLTDGDQTCKTLGDFKFVKKIICEGTFLYVMTQNAVYQIIVDQLKFTASSPMDLNAMQVITATQLAPNSYCLDMIIDRGVILLGTTAGLYSINVVGGLPGVVASIPIPMGLPAVSKIQAVSYDENYGFGDIDYGFYSSSNVYVLSIDFATEQARLNRFTVSDGVITPIQDQLLPGQNGPLLILDYMSNNMFIDGSLGFMTSYRIGIQPPVIKYLEYTLHAGMSGRHYGLKANTADISIVLAKDSSAIAGINRDPASGCLLMAADFGLLADS